MKPTKPLKLQRCYEVAFSDDGALLITLSRDVIGWDVAGRKKRFRVHPLSHPASCAIHPKGDRLAVKSTAGKIALLDGTDGALVRMLADARDDEGSNVAYSPCGEYLVDGSWKGQLSVRSATTGDLTFQKAFPGEMITRVGHSKRGDKWFVVHQPKTVENHKSPASAYISIWHWPFSSPSDRLMAHENSIKAIAVSPDDSHLCLLGYNSITIMRIEGKEVVASAPYVYGGTQFAVAWSPDGQELATVQKHSFVFYMAPTMEKRHTIEQQYASDVAYSPDGKLLALGSWNSGLLLERTDVQQGVPGDVAASRRRA